MMISFLWRRRYDILKYAVLLGLIGLLIQVAFLSKTKEQAFVPPGNLNKVLELDRLKLDVARADRYMKPNIPKELKNEASKGLFSCNFPTTMRENVTALIDMMGNDWHWKFIAERIKNNWDHWTQAARKLCTEKNKCTRKRKKIMILPGVLQLTPYAHPETINAGGPLGDLIQWADLIASLYVLGHDLTLEWEIRKALNFLPLTEEVASSSDCNTLPDLIYVDISILMKMSEMQRNAIKCHLRVVDAYGTQAMFNDKQYAESHGNRNHWSNFNLNLKQYLTFYPHTEDNSFLGFSTFANVGATKSKENLGVIYGKESHYFKGKRPYLNQLLHVMELVANVKPRAAVSLPGAIKNLGVLPPKQHQDVMSRAKFLVGLKDPLESTAAIGALARGCVFLNPSFSGQERDRLRGRPTSRKISSQITYLEEYVGKPYVITLNIDNLTEVETVVKQNLNKTVKPWVPHEFTPLGMLERVNAYVDNQDFCNKSRKIWPPLSARQMHKGNLGQSCTQVCKDKALTCEPVYFETMNTPNIFKQFSLACNSTTKGEDLYYPAYQTKGRKCVLQGRPLLFSCEGSHKALQRLCPCRDYIKYQIALCRHC